jgi:hypothetical protein
MPLNDALLNIGVTAMQGAALYIQIHTALPNTSGSNEATSARILCSWPAAANGDFGTLSNKAFTGGAASGPATYVGFWSALTVGTFYGYLPLTGDQTFNAAGAYTVTSLSIPGTAT